MKSKNHRPLNFIGEGWNTDVSLAGIVSAFEITWICPLDPHLSRIISYPL